jgi:hypothetical protein
MRSLDRMTRIYVKRLVVSMLSLSSLLLAAQLLAQEEEGPEYIVDKLDDSKKDGVDWRIDSGATFDLNDNRNVIGQQDGTAMTFGYKFDAGVDIRGDGHEWRNSITLAAGMGLTPGIDQMVKTRDVHTFETIYLYHVVDWFGPFARFAAETNAHAGAAVTGEPTTYAISNLDGTTDTRTTRKLQLTDPFRPTRLKESLGLFAQPVARDPISVEFRAGAGAREIFAADQRAVTDNADTPEVEVSELDDVNQLGAEVVFEIWGHFVEKKLNYKLKAEAMTPFLHNELPAGDDRSAFELTNISLLASLSLKVVEWASLDYEFRADREPQLLDDFQIRNHLLVTFGLATGNQPKTEE